MSSAVTPADELQARAGALLTPFADVRVEDDGSLAFHYAGALCSLRAVNLSDDLDVLSLVCVLEWDRTTQPGLAARIADRNDVVQFGTLQLVEHGDKVDVLLRYTFPAAGLTDDALTTMLLLVLSSAETSRQGLFK